MRIPNSKKQIKARFSFLLVVLLLLAVMITGVGCGNSSFDPSAYVRSFMDLLTKGEVKEYMKLSGESEEEAMEQYKAMTDSISESIGAYGASEEVQARFVEVFKKILAKSKYEVGEAKKTDDDGYEVPVTIEPITGLYDGLTQELQDEATEYGEEIAKKGESIDQAVMTDWVFNKLLDKMEERLDSIAYGEPQTITVVIKKTDDGYEIDDAEALGQQIGLALIDTNDSAQ